MVNCLVLAIVGVLLISHYGEVNCAPKLSASLLKAWDEFKANNGKSYDTEEEAEKRLGIFAQNYQSIQEHNERLDNGEETYQQGITQFADMTPEEFAQQYLEPNDPKKNSMLLGFENTTNSNFNQSSITLGYPTTLDMRTQMNPVRNQLNCRCGYAFSALASLEYAYRKKYNQLLDFSEQQIVNCDPYNAGCWSGDPLLVYLYVWLNGINLESKYGYTGTPSACPSSQIRSPGTYKNLNYGAYLPGYQLPTVEQIKSFLYTEGVQSVYMDGSALQFYQNGIISGSACKHLNHAVNLVGYGSDYWLVRNSFGSNWGENGYFRVKSGSGTCDLFFKIIFYVKYI